MVFENSETDMKPSSNNDKRLIHVSGKMTSPGVGGGGGGVLGISSDREDRMAPKVKTQKIP